MRHRLLKAFAFGALAYAVSAVFLDLYVYALNPGSSNNYVSNLFAVAQAPATYLFPLTVGAIFFFFLLLKPGG